MLRAPICTTSAWAKIASACWLSSSSVTTGRPVCCRASARISSASAPRPLNANGEVRGLKAPPRSMDAPASLTARATPSVCSRDSTVHGPAMRQNVSPPPTRRPSMSTTVGCSWLSSDEASLYGREIGTTRSTPLMPSSPSSATPSGSPMAPMAVVSSPGITTTCTPVVSSRARTAATSASVAWGVMTIITAAPTLLTRGPGRLEPEVAHAELVEADVVGELVAHGAGDLVAQQVGVVSEVAAQGVAVDDDAVGDVVAAGAVAVVEAVGAPAPASVGDDDRDVVVLHEVAQQVGEIVERVAHELLEVVVVVGVEIQELGLLGLRRHALAGQALGPQDDLLEVLLGLRLAPAGHAQADGDGAAEDDGGDGGNDRQPLDRLDGRIDAEALEDHDQRQAGAQRDRGGEHDATGGRHQPLMARAMTTRWISLVPS